MDNDTLFEVKGMKLFNSNRHIYEKNRTPSCATPSQIAVLMGIIDKHLFQDGSPVKKVIEIGVDTGMSSIFMLKASALKNYEITIYGIDINPNAGFLVSQNCTNEEMSKWKFFGGKTSRNIVDILGPDKIDVAFIDGMHAHPGPLLDFLYLFPFFRDDAIVLFHDVDTYLQIGELGGAYFYDAFSGNKRLNYNVDNSDFKPQNNEYMGIIRLPHKMDDLFLNLIKVAKVPFVGSFFRYGSEEDSLGISNKDIQDLHLYMNKYYPRYFSDEMYSILMANLDKYKSETLFWKHQNRILNFAVCEHFNNLPINNLKEKIDALQNNLNELNNIVHNYIQLSSSNANSTTNIKEKSYKFPNIVKP